MRTSGAERASGVYKTQAEAVRHARNEARRNGVTLFVHRNDGTIREVHSYGPGATPPKG